MITRMSAPELPPDESDVVRLVDKTTRSDRRVAAILNVSHSITRLATYGFA